MSVDNCPKICGDSGSYCMKDKTPQVCHGCNKPCDGSPGPKPCPKPSPKPGPKPPDPRP